jgi:hypothetical protein
LTWLFPSPARADLSTGLVGWWKLDDGTGASSASDSSGKGHAGTLGDGSCSAGSDPCPTWATGKMGGALNFDGSDNVKVPSLDFNPNPYFPIGEAPRTLAAWIYPVGDNGINGIVHYGQDDCQGFMFGISRQSGTGNLGFWGGCVDFSSTLAAPLNQWTFAAVTYDGSTTITVYRNTDSQSFNTGDPLDTHDSHFFIGAETTSNGNDDGEDNSGGYRNHFFGLIDDVRIYNRALSAAEVASLFQLGSLTKNTIGKAVIRKATLK